MTDKINIKSIFSYYYMSVDFEGYGFKIKAPSQEEAMTNINKGYQQLVRFLR